MEYPVLTWRVGRHIPPSAWNSLKEVMKYPWTKPEEVRVGMWYAQPSGLVWQELETMRKAHETSKTETTPVPTETLKSVPDSQTTADLEARIKKLQDAVEVLQANDKVHTETVDALGSSWRAHEQKRIGELETKALVAEGLFKRIDRLEQHGLDVDKGIYTIKTEGWENTAKIKGMDAVWRELDARVSQLESNAEMECQPWCTLRGHHTVCSPPPEITPAAAVTSPGNPGETARREVFQDWRTEKGPCNCDIGVRHTHWNRLPVGIRLKPGPLPCRPGCIYKPPHEGTSCVVLE